MELKLLKKREEQRRFLEEAMQAKELEVVWMMGSDCFFKLLLETIKIDLISFSKSAKFCIVLKT